MDTLPPLRKVFNPATNNTRTLELLRDVHGITSMAPLTMLSVEDIGNLDFIITMDAKRISRLMAGHKVPQRKYNEAAPDFLARAFEDSRYAPIGVLHVMMVRHKDVERGDLAPLQLVEILERAIPEATVGDLMDFTRKEVLRLVKAAAYDNPKLHCADPELDMMHLGFRLNGAGLVIPRKLAR